VNSGWQCPSFLSCRHSAVALTSWRLITGDGHLVVDGAPGLTYIPLRDRIFDVGVCGMRRAIVGVVSVALLFGGTLPVLSDELTGVAAEALIPIDPQAPTEHGDSPVDGLQYADPTEGLSIIDAPEANNEGTAKAVYALEIPPGHGITPDLNVVYSSSASNGWMGVGWNLSVGEIAVDTSFGAPHFDGSFESESYIHDGDLLIPNAINGEWEPRVAETRRDYTHQVETEYAEIIRHVVNDGGPDDYFWEVRMVDPTTTSGRSVERMAESGGTGPRPTVADLRLRAPNQCHRSTRVPSCETPTATSSAGCCQQSVTSGSTSSATSGIPSPTPSPAAVGSWIRPATPVALSVGSTPTSTASCTRTRPVLSQTSTAPRTRWTSYVSPRCPAAPAPQCAPIRSSTPVWGTLTCWQTG
jgi:hypothetical protein